MAEFQEDMLFKNVSDEDAGILLGFFGKKSKKIKVWTKELRHIDPKNFRPDLILELDDENLIMEFQSTEVNDDFSRRGHSYVAITDQNKKNNKEVNLAVLSSVENSKIVEYIYRIVKILKRLKNLTISQKDLAFGIMWLTTDKFVEDPLERNILCDFIR